MAHMTLGDDTAIGVKDGYFIRTVPSTVLTTDADIIIMIDDAIVKLDIRVRGTTTQALGVDAVVTRHRVKELTHSGKCPCFHLSHTTPLDIWSVEVLFIAGYFTAVASHTGSHIKVKAVLFSLFELGDIYLIVSTLHASVCFVVDKTL